MKILVTGASGQLGHDVCRELDRRGIENLGPSSREMDICNREAVYETLEGYMPDAVIHCAAYTRVDMAESEPERCWSVNADGTRNIASVCRKLNIKLLYVSSEYVFPGTGDSFYRTDDAANPRNVYGASKLAGELAVKSLLRRSFILRTSWVFGENGGNFIKTVLRLSETRDKISVVCDQIGSPSYTADLAPLLCDMVLSEKYGVYHATNEGVCSRFELAQEIFRLAGRNIDLIPVSTAQFPSPAARPLNSRLDNSSLTNAGFQRLPDWHTALEAYIKKII